MHEPAVVLTDLALAILGAVLCWRLSGLAAATFEAMHTRSRGWALVALGLTVSAAAALLQQTRVALHPVYFDHNAVYHVVQGAAVVLLYLGFHARPPRTDPAARAG
jgi:hypothetical protein